MCPPAGPALWVQAPGRGGKCPRPEAAHSGMQCEHKYYAGLYQAHFAKNHSSSLYAPATPQCETQGRVGAKTNTPGKDVGSFVRLFLISANLIKRLMEKTGLLESLHQTNTAKCSNLSLGDPIPVSRPTDASLTLRRADPNVLLPGETIILLPLGGRLKENRAVKRRAGAADEKLRRLIRKPSRLHDEKAEAQPCENRTGD